MSFAPGTRLGPYEILTELGAGGMGVVYKARDTRLERIVAIKLLRTQDSDQGNSKWAESKRRFLQEARAASSLHHPHIVTIFDINAYAGQDFLVMEYVEGRTLSDLITSRSMRLSEVLRVAIQIADALGAAHAAGIVHRDLKPGNVMVNAQGQVKVLDFGLAKLIGHEGALSVGAGETGEATHTLAEQAHTGEGTILGSVAYMSPEQAEGKPVDARSDIFAFGAVLYEMVTGRRAFQGESRISTLAAVLHKDPPSVTQLAAATPPELDRIITRCLRKDVARRSQNISDVKLALKELKEDSESGNGSYATRGRKQTRAGWLWGAIAGTCVLITTGALGWQLAHRGTKQVGHSELVRVSPDDEFTYTEPAISPDGKFVAYVSDRGGDSQIWLQQIGGGDPIQLTHDNEPEWELAFSPDGTHIAYASRLGLQQSMLEHGAIRTIPTLGGTPRELDCDGICYRPSFSPDGRRLVYVEFSINEGNKLMVAPTEGGAAMRIPNKPLGLDGFTWPRWVDDRRILTQANLPRSEGQPLQTDWFVLPLDGGRPISTGAAQIIQTAGLKIAPASAVYGDRVIFYSGGHVWEVPLSRSSWKISGRPRQLTYGTEPEVAKGVSSTGLAAISISRRKSDVWLVPMNSVEGKFTGTARRLTLDSRSKLAVRALGNARYFQLLLGSYVNVLHNVDTGKETVFPGYPAGTIFSRDGRFAAINQPTGDVYSVTLRRIDFHNPAEVDRVLCDHCGAPSDFSPDSRFLFYDPNGDSKTFFQRAVHLLEVATGKSRPWLNIPGTWWVSNVFGEHDEWVLAEVERANDKQKHLYLIPWKEQAPPETEWVDVTRVYSPSLRTTAGSNLFYTLQGKDLVAVRFDAATRSLADQPFRIDLPSGSQPVLEPDSWDIGAAGLVFLRSKTSGSVWLMKLPD